MELFGEHGFDQVTVDDIAAAADVAKGTFFNYFPSKDHLLVEYRRTLFDFVHDYGESLEGESARQLFKKLFRRLARRIKSEGDRYTMLFRQVLTRRHLVTLDPDQQGRYRPYFRRFLELGRETGEVPADVDLDELAETIRDLWGGASTHWVLEQPSTSLETRVLRRLDLLFDLLADAADQRASG